LQLPRIAVSIYFGWLVNDLTANTLIGLGFARFISVIVAVVTAILTTVILHLSRNRQSFS
jgi:hypothetical protein